MAGLRFFVFHRMLIETKYIIANLGMSNNFGFVDLENLVFPTTMSIDYIRVYQKAGHIKIGCDPDDFPTQAYINEYISSDSRSRQDANGIQVY